jgi:hypothetical protein
MEAERGGLPVMDGYEATHRITTDLALLESRLRGTLKHRFFERRRRAHSRRELMSLSDAELNGWARKRLWQGESLADKYKIVTRIGKNLS